MQQKHRYDLNDLYAMFLSFGIANLRGALQFCVPLVKGFQIHSHTTTWELNKLTFSEVQRAVKSYFRSSQLHGLDHLNS